MKERFSDLKDSLKNKIGEQEMSLVDNNKNSLVKNDCSQEKGFMNKAKDSIINAIDENGNGQIDIEDIIIKGLKVPGIKIDRAEFLTKQLMKWYPQEVIDKVITTTPMKANIPLDVIDNIADEVIKYERNCVSGISAALSTPGGFAMVATLPADIIQYYGYMLRVMQKLLYLYGFSQIDTTEKKEHFDDATMNTLIICFGVMYGVSGASNALKTMAKALATGVEKQLLRKALTKGTLYPIVKKVAKWFGVKMTKDVFARSCSKAIPLVGGIIGGGITFMSFKPCCDKLKLSLQDTILSNPKYKPQYESELDDISDIATDINEENEDLLLDLNSDIE